jgi:hypothetical protein
MTTDLDANGFKIKNLHPGSGFTQAQADWSQTDAAAPDFIKNKPAIPVVPTLAEVATSGSYNDLTDKPTIPAPVDISGKADKSEMVVTPGTGANADKTTIQLKSGTSATVLTQHQDISGKADTSDVNAALVQKANASDLPYALVTQGEWEFSGDTVSFDNYSVAVTGPKDGYYTYTLYVGGDTPLGTANHATDDMLTVDFNVGPESTITATRASLPGHLCARANNLIDATSGNVTLTLPPFVAGKVRDMLVACTIGLDTNDEPWSVIFQGVDGEEISFKAEGDDAASATFPVPDAAGDWWYSLTERAPHVFAVSLKQLQSVSQPTQTQGGS